MNTKLLRLLEEDSTLNTAQLAAAADMTEEEVKYANAAIIASTNATAEEWLDSWEEEQRKAQQFTTNLATLLSMGVSAGLIDDPVIYNILRYITDGACCRIFMVS